VADECRHPLRRNDLALVGQPSLRTDTEAVGDAGPSLLIDRRVRHHRGVTTGIQVAGQQRVDPGAHRALEDVSLDLPQPQPASSACAIATLASSLSTQSGNCLAATSDAVCLASRRSPDA